MDNTVHDVPDYDSSSDEFARARPILNGSTKPRIQTITP
jgi:hypothetical protein